MEELERGLEISMKGPAAAKAAARALDQVAAWGLSMPDVDPLVLDFGLGEFDRIGEIEFWIANEVNEGYCGKYLFLFEGQTCPAHMHRQKLETFFLTKGKLRVRYRGRDIILDQGGVLRVDRGALHEFTAIVPSLLLEVSMPSIIQDNYFEDRNIPIGGNYAGGE